MLLKLTGLSLPPEHELARAGCGSSNVPVGGKVALLQRGLALPARRRPLCGVRSMSPAHRPNGGSAKVSSPACRDRFICRLVDGLATLSERDSGSRRNLFVCSRNEPPTGPSGQPSPPELAAPARPASASHGHLGLPAARCCSVDGSTVCRPSPTARPRLSRALQDGFEGHRRTP